MAQKLDRSLLKSKRWIIDGANGSEIQRLSEEATGDFGAMSALTQAKIIEKVHRLYVEAGANFIIANTYSSNYNILTPMKQEHKCKELIEDSIKLANKAIDGTSERFVAASISEHPPFDEKFQLSWPEEKQEIENWEKTLRHLFDQRIDCLFLELIRTKEHGITLAKSVNKVWKNLPEDKKVPIFIGLVPEFDSDEKSLRFMRPHYTLKNKNYENFNFSAENIKYYFNALSDVNLLGVNIMHCDFDVVTPAVKVLRDVWDGPVGVYPQNGYWDYPEWIALDINFDKATVQLAEWLELDVNMFGGCCGTNPKFIKFLANKLRDDLKNIEDGVFQHKSILIQENISKDTVLASQHWTMKQTMRKGGCACCVLKEEESKAEESKQRLLPQKTRGNVLSGQKDNECKKEDIITIGGSNNRYVDGKTSFAFDPTVFSVPVM